MTWKRLIPLCFVLIPSFSFGKGAPKQFAVYDFSKGLDSYHSPLSLPDGFVQASNDVLFDAKAPVSKRQGFTVAFSTKGYQYQQLWTYVDISNTSWLIVRASDTIVANRLDGSLSVKVATISANNLVGQSNAFGNSYFVDQTQGVYYWNGSSTTYVANSPFGSIMNSFHNRLCVAGAAPPNGNQLYCSKQNDGMTWTIGINPDDPIQLPVGLQDNFDNITALYVYLDTEYIFKHYSTYAMYGFDKTNFEVRQLTQECGCVDGNTVQTFAGGLKFVSMRGFEHFDGYNCTRISDPVKNFIEPAIQSGSFSGQSWVQSQTSDWTSGTMSQLDTTTYSPALALVNLSTTIPNNSFETGDFTSWTTTTSWIVSTGTICGQSQCWTPHTGSYFAVATANGINTAVKNNSFVIASLVYSTDTATIISSGSFVTSGAIEFDVKPLYGTSVILSLADNANHVLSSNAFYLSSSRIGFFAQGAQRGAAYICGPDICLDWMMSVDSFDDNIRFSTVYSSGTFRSQIHAVSPISSWGNFSAQNSLSGGSIAFSICSSSNSNMSKPVNCSSQTVNGQITISTGTTGATTYVQWYATFTVTAATQTAALNSVTVGWFSGSRPVPMASTVWDNRYWLSLTTTTTDTANDATLVLNKNGAWSLFSIKAGGFSQYKNNLYHSDSQASGNVYLDNQGYSDNGNPINAYVWTKDYPFVNLAQDASLIHLYPTFGHLANASINLSYFVDSSTASYSVGPINQNEFSNSASIHLAAGAGNSLNQVFGHTFSFYVQQNDANPMDFYGLRALYSEREIP